MDTEKQFYVCEKKFWDDWSDNISFYKKDQELGLKTLNKFTIKNARLLEERHEIRMTEKAYNEDYILLPKHAFLPLSMWYGCDKTITRDVIFWKDSSKK